jgi:hypothetical protein
MIRILDLTSDSYLIAAQGELQLDHVPIGLSVNPWREDQSVPRGKPLHALVKLLAARFGAYDWVILPPVHVGWMAVNPGAFKAFKSVVRWAASKRFLTAIVRRVVFSGRCSYAICDASDMDTPSFEFLRLSGAKVYFKRNLIQDVSLLGATVWEPLPMPVPDAWLDDPRTDFPKTRDYFCAGEYTTPLRKELLGLGKSLASAGWQPELIEERVTPEEFWDRLASARICAAAQGYGYHSWRMFEAAGLGSVPLINRPPSGMWHWFEDGTNCIFAEETVGATGEKVQQFLKTPAKLESMAREARAQVDRWHRRSTLSANIRATLERAMSRDSSATLN